MTNIYKNLDAAQGIYMETELESMKSKAYQVEYPELMARQVFPAAQEVSHPGSQSVSYEMYDQVGMAKILHSYAQDLPAIEVEGSKYVRQVYTGAVSHSYSVDDIDAASMAGKPMSAMKMQAARRALLQLENKLAFKGDGDIPSFFNNSNFTSHDADQKWDSSATADDVLDDLLAAQEAMVDASNGVELPDTLLLPQKQYSLLATMPRSAQSDTTVLQFFLANSPYISTVLPVHECKGALGAAVNTSKDCAVMYKRSPEKLWLEVVKDVTFMPAQEDGLMLKIPSYFKTAGVICPYPKSVCIVKGI